MEQAPSNIKRYDNGAKIYQLMVLPAIIDLLRVGAHYAISALFNGKQKTIYAYQILQDEIERRQNGQLKIAIGKATIKSEVTLEKDKISFAVLHLGDHNVNGGIRSYMDEGAYQKMDQEISAAFDQANIADIIRLMDKHFGTNSYSLWYLFKDEQRKVIQKILQPNLEQTERSVAQLYADNYAIMNFLKQLNIPMPNSLVVITEQAINQELKKLFSQESIGLEKLEDLIQEIQGWSVNIDHTTLAFKISAWVNRKLEELSDKPDDISQIREITNVLDQLKEIEIQLHLWKAQNIYFRMKQELISSFQEKAEQEDENAASWLGEFKKLGVMLSIGVS